MSTEALEWQADVLEALDGRAVHVAPPVRIARGELVVQGWTAWQETPPRGADRLPHTRPVFPVLRPVRSPSQVVHGHLTG